HPENRGQPEGPVRVGRLLLVTFLGEARKVTCRRAAPAPEHLRVAHNTCYFILSNCAVNLQDGLLEKPVHPKKSGEPLRKTTSPFLQRGQASPTLCFCWDS
ncbi:MAG: hypothetical protein ACYCZR_13945, partial [Burkholderiales bacterium]